MAINNMSFPQTGSGRWRQIGRVITANHTSDYPRCFLLLSSVVVSVDLVLPLHEGGVNIQRRAVVYRLCLVHSTNSSVTSKACAAPKVHALELDMSQGKSGRWAPVVPKRLARICLLIIQVVLKHTMYIGWIISGSFALLATVVSFWLINKHLQFYTNKREQRYIVRILFMVPLYAIVSFASFLFWNHSTVLILVRDAYESTVLTSFFYLLLTYISPDPDEQKAVFIKVGVSREADRKAIMKGDEVKKWIFPLGFLKWKPRDGLYFLQLCKWGVLQYCVIRPTTTLAAVILDSTGLYCEESWGLGWGHIYIVIIVSISVTVAMYCLIQLYVPVSRHLAPHHPLLKLFAIKAVVFLTFWQATFLSILSMFGLVKDTRYMTVADVNIGIGTILETVEMTVFAFLHIRAFSYKPYMCTEHPDSLDAGFKKTSRLRSLGHVIDFRETFREIWIGSIYLWDRIRGQEPTHDVGARRTNHYEGAFGRPRAFQQKAHFDGADETDKDISATLPQVEIEVEEQAVHVEGERQWLGLGDNYAYGLKYFMRERSDTLGVQIEKELEQRILMSDVDRDQYTHGTDLKHGTRKRESSWWRRIYNRLSHYGSEDDQGESLATRHLEQVFPQITKTDDDDYQRNLDDPPPINRTTSELASLPGFSNPPVAHQLTSYQLVTQNDRYPGRPTRIDSTAASADSLLGRIFPTSAENQLIELVDAGSSRSSHDRTEGRRERLFSDPQKYHEIGISGHIPPLVTRHRDRDQPGSSTSQRLKPLPEVLVLPRFYHQRESAIHHSVSGAGNSAPIPRRPSSPRVRRSGERSTTVLSLAAPCSSQSATIMSPLEQGPLRFINYQHTLSTPDIPEHQQSQS